MPNLRRLSYRWRRRAGFTCCGCIDLAFSRCLFYDGDGIGNMCGLEDVLLPFYENRWGV